MNDWELQVYPMRVGAEKRSDQVMGFEIDARDGRCSCHGRLGEWKGGGGMIVTMMRVAQGNQNRAASALVVSSGGVVVVVVVVVAVKRLSNCTLQERERGRRDPGAAGTTRKNRSSNAD